MGRVLELRKSTQALYNDSRYCRRTAVSPKYNEFNSVRTDRTVTQHRVARSRSVGMTYQRPLVLG